MPPRPKAVVKEFIPPKKEDAALLMMVSPEALACGLSPKEVMLNGMRQFYLSGRLHDAVKTAGWVAPYVHPRLASIEITEDPKAAKAIDLTKAEDLEVVRRIAYLFFMAGQGDKQAQERVAQITNGAAKPNGANGHAPPIAKGTPQA